jgi:2-iminoacetate synthase
MTQPSATYPDFMDEARLQALLDNTPEDPVRVRAAIARSLAKEPLTEEECAALLAARSPELREEAHAAARELKRLVYGNRIVLFAPLYIGNHCVNDCAYCGFRRSLRSTVRKTLTPEELTEQVVALESRGHKRLILVFGEHPHYTPEFMADTVRRVYAIRHGPGAIRRVNLNAAPLDHAGFRTVKAAGIGTYQIFQETYHHETYGRVHPPQTHKGDYLWRLHGLTRAWEAGCDDVGLGALFGLYDWRFEVLALVRHARFLVDRFQCGPHTISFPRIRPAHGTVPDPSRFVSDEDFRHLVAVLRLSVPYTGLILTAREPAEIRRQVLEFGVSQIDAGTRIELGGYTRAGEQELRREQFMIGDLRSLDEIARDLMEHGYVPSFCTSCYRQGRTGQQFMEYAVPGFIERFCTPNALLTLAEYLEDYASPETRAAGDRLLESELARLGNGPDVKPLRERLARIRTGGERDLYY